MLGEKLYQRIYHILAYKKAIPYPYRKFLFKLLTMGNTIEKKSISKETEQINKKGFVYLPRKNLTEHDILGIRNHLTDCEYKDVVNGEKLVRRNYERRDLVKSEKIVELALDEEIVRICSAYFGAQARVAYITSWTTYTNDVNSSGELSFHMDHHGHIFLKLFIYLDDVEVGDGEHQYIVGTTDIVMPKVLKRMKEVNKNLYQKMTLKRQKAGSYRLDNTEVSSYFGNDVVHQVGPAGTCFLEDTYGLHRGSAIKSQKPRTVLQVLYCPLVMEKDSSKHIRVNRPKSVKTSHFMKCMASSFDISQ
jgi:hypothetical protein